MSIKMNKVQVELEKTLASVYPVTRDHILMNESSATGFVDVGCGLPGIQMGIGLTDRNAVATPLEETHQVVGLNSSLPSD